ncbi:MAG: hypothetical protein HOU81_17510 [Hamadaea sp.]|uniref:hypothetical protein n=1 Tax=Hamadaea sp. TaxID=2024425 RepID=UPI00178E6FC4|nr:hypothetical protein [Hamadaea sp.]NUR72618.1 hypothetical protein [Hamadaea sp.]NUT23087.1 hypothetical protein [Hamadaea sp.]
MIPLARMRLIAYVKSGRVLAPGIVVLLALLLFHGGGKAEAAEAYAVCALILFPAYAWQTRVILDGDPDVQRRLALVAVGSARREQVAGLLAALAAGLVVTGVSLVLPWLTGAVKAQFDPLAQQLAIGVWAHLLALAAGVALGALSSRAVTESAGKGVGVLAVGSVLAIVLGLPQTPLVWLIPPMTTIAKTVSRDSLTLTSTLGYTVQAAVWVALALTVYARLRRNRA